MIQYQEHDIEAVWRYFVDGFQPPAGQKVLTFDAFFDPTKGKVIFRLVVTDPDPNPARK